MRYTRREFGHLALGTLAGARTVRRLEGRSAATLGGGGELQSSPVAIPGIHFGVQTYSFRDIPRGPDGDAVAPIANAMRACGFTECELWAPQIEPVGKSREELRVWRSGPPLDYFRGIRQRFEAVGIKIYAYNYSPNASYTDTEIDRGFAMARALGAQIITASTTLAVAKRMAPFAAKYRTIVAMHGHSNVTDPNEFATPDSFAAAMQMSEYFKVNLDIGHFTAANFDPIAYLRAHHGQITNLHLKDRRRNQGPNTPWGEGDTPIREVLRLLKREGWPVRAYVEYEYKGRGTPIEEVRKCVAFARAAVGDGK